MEVGTTMFYDSELSFTTRFLEFFHLNSTFITKDFKNISEIDFELRKLLGMEDSYEKLLSYLWNSTKPNTIYKFTDNFYSTYLFLDLPDTEQETKLIIGPYTLVEITRQKILEFMEIFDIPAQMFISLEKYFNSIPYMDSDNQLFVLMNTLGEKMWNGLDNFTVENIDYNTAPEKISSDVQTNLLTQIDSTTFMKALENQYEIENQVMQAVSLGLKNKADLVSGSFSVFHTEQRAVDPIRNIQNYSIILNTLLRKSAEQGGVHPLYIDRLSSEFAYKIEKITTLDSARKLQNEMVHKYCLLVKNHSMKGYSLLIQKVITQMDSDLTADLTLNTLAHKLNVNPSYLSTLFKKETGVTLTEYVNRRRIEHSILLLNSTSLQIQTIAQHCGIPDVNYFTKMFKKQIGKTPKEYRELIMRSSSQNNNNKSL